MVHSRFPKTHIRFWSDFSQAVEEQNLKGAWLEKFDQVLKKRPTSKQATSDVIASAQSAKSFYRLDLNRDLGGYSIGPHTDTLGKLITTLYYLPADKSLQMYGTSVVKILQRRFVKHMTVKTWETGVRKGLIKVVRLAKFLPNSVFAFSPCKDSWHAVKGHTGGDLMRDSLQGFVQKVHPGNIKKMKSGRCS
eukprot:CAMPEP_0181361166 /NCGR_PEP_ID=MMETSP1106-20121128/7121_1 /TAXON_ID=81844 /ORGANISM="Mantoniella antarctica, Strain SL-175" /LENGTH=191 /DNA_ID=CAMNT_0023474621 /DNA_START=609 /DNA_END=1184 /DNA_ORIENTATION=-